MKEKKNHKVYWQLFGSTFYLSAFTFGGGFVIIPLMKQKFVDQLHWLEEEEMLNLTAIAQSAPGAVAVNASILLGYRVAGVPGALLTILGTILPPFLILSVISVCYTAFRTNEVVGAVLHGMQAGVAAVICDVVLNLGAGVVRQKHILSILVMIGAFIATYVLGVNVIYIILACGVLGAVEVLIKERRAAEEGAR